MQGAGARSRRIERSRQHDLAAPAEPDEQKTAGWQPEFVLAAIDANPESAQSKSALSALAVDPKLLAAASALGSGSHVIGVYRQRWSDPGGDVSVYLHGVRDPDQVWTAAHVDEDWNAEKWGVDEEVAARRAARLVDFQAAVSILDALKA